jgi:hypothetical protein
MSAESIVAAENYPPLFVAYLWELLKGEFTMDLKFLRFRDEYLCVIQEALELNIYAERLKARAEAIDALAYKNAALIGDASPSFVYKDKMYNAITYHPKPGSNKAIHPDLIDEVCDVLDKEEYEVVVEENRVKNYIRNVLAACRHIDDLRALIPGRIAKPLQQVKEDVINIGSPMSEEQIDKFKEAHENEYGAFKRLFLMRLLLAK